MSRIAIALVSISMVASASAAYGEPCNPVVDGTYCATQMTNSRAQPSGSAYRFQPIDGLGVFYQGHTTSRRLSAR